MKKIIIIFLTILFLPVAASADYQYLFDKVAAEKAERELAQYEGVYLFGTRSSEYKSQLDDAYHKKYTTCNSNRCFDNAPLETYKREVTDPFDLRMFETYYTKADNTTVWLDSWGRDYPCEGVYEPQLIVKKVVKPDGKVILVDGNGIEFPTGVVEVRR